MVVPQPESFIQTVAAVTAAMAFLFGVGSLWSSRAMRLCAILSVISLSLFANNAVTYFAAVFIVATAVTELGFLEKLVAIIRGNKDYFDYQKELLTSQEAQRRASAQINDLAVALPKQGEPTSDAREFGMVTHGQHIVTKEVSGSATRLGYAVEQLAITYVEKRLGEAAERNVRFTKGERSVEFDGIVQRSGGRPDIIIEVRLVPPSRIRELTRDAAESTKRRLELFEEITGRRAMGRIVLVIEDRRQINDDPKGLDALARELSHKLQVDVADFSDIGLVVAKPIG